MVASDFAAIFIGDFVTCHTYGRGMELTHTASRVLLEPGVAYSSRVGVLGVYLVPPDLIMYPPVPLNL